MAGGSGREPAITFAPGKLKVAAAFLLTFLTIESPMMSVVGEGTIGGEHVSRDGGWGAGGRTMLAVGALCDACDGGEGAGERVELAAGALCGAGVN
ncbi:hypothetical protein EYF80_045702 [Liparis tanakae]|uniref:Uncharacterized protein n=1 Tax=Liparis tanakae TaxID=230148 RepID=A0A4Z2FTD4_9TELE|nr:hypothetical protein EYF80_045702 [Liparis tanakae]